MRSDRPSARWLATALAVLVTFVVAVVAPFVRTPADSVVAEGGADAGRDDAPAPLVVLGFSGVNWSNVDPETTPTLYSLIDSGASANLVVKTTGITTCPNAGWATLYYGVRAATPPDLYCESLVDTKLEGTILAPIASEFDGRQQDSAYGIPEQTLRTLLSDHTIATVGPGAVLAMMHTDPVANIQSESLEYPTGVAENAADAYDLVAGSDLVMMDLGRIIDVEAVSDGASAASAAFSGPREIGEGALSKIAILDRELGSVLDRIPDGTNVMILSVADADNVTARLQLFSVVGPAAEAGTEAYSNSTRHDGLVQLTDVPQTILTLMGEEVSPDFVGSQIHLTGGDKASIGALDDVLERALAVRPAVGPYYVMTGLLASAFIVFALWKLRRRDDESGAVPRLGSKARFAGLAVPSLPVASFLANVLPWWRIGSSTIAFLVLVLVLACAIAALARWMARFRIAGAAVVAGVTAATIGLDAIFGSTLHASSVLGDQPQSGGRFYGLSNAPFAIFAVAMIFLTAFAIRELKTYRASVSVPVAIVLLGLSASIIDGAPSIGADFGGPPAIVIAFLVMLFLALGKSFTGRTVALIGISGAAIAMLLAFADWLRPADSRTHLGNFFQDAINGEFFAVVARKLGLLWNSVPWFAWILALVVVYVAYRWWTRGSHVGLESERALEIKWAVIATVVLSLVGLVINDSGLVIPLFGIIFGMPLAITVSQWATESQRVTARD